MKTDIRPFASARWVVFFVQADPNGCGRTKCVGPLQLSLGQLQGKDAFHPFASVWVRAAKNHGPTRRRISKFCPLGVHVDASPPQIWARFASTRTPDGRAACSLGVRLRPARLISNHRPPVLLNCTRALGPACQPQKNSACASFLMPRMLWGGANPLHPSLRLPLAPYPPDNQALAATTMGFFSKRDKHH